MRASLPPGPPAKELWDARLSTMYPLASAGAAPAPNPSARISPSALYTSVSATIAGGTSP